MAGQVYDVLKEIHLAKFYDLVVICKRLFGGSWTEAGEAYNELLANY